MISLLLTFISMAVVGIAIPLLGLLSEQSHGTKLEQYINSKNPMDVGDIERLTTEFERKNHQRYL